MSLSHDMWGFFLPPVDWKKTDWAIISYQGEKVQSPKGQENVAKLVRIAGGGENGKGRNNTYLNCCESFKELHLKN